MSSHREAPEISKDPVADSTDTYAFVSPNPAEAGTVTLITNYIPLEDPAGGPNFYEFGEDVLYRINVDNNGDGWPDVMFEFTFPTEVRKASFLYNNGPIERLESDNWNRRQHGTVVEVRGIDRTTLGDGLLLPPCNIGPRSTPNYPDLAAAATYDLGDGIRFFAGQRLDGFYVDLGSVFDLGALRPFQNLHFIPLPMADGRNALRAFNVHTIAIQVPIERLTRDGSVPTDPLAPEAVIGVWASAHRQKGRFTDETATTRSGPFTQVSRLGNPLVNEVLIPVGSEGRAGTARDPTRTPSSPSTSPARSWRRCCRCCIPACSPTWRRSTPIAPTSSRSSTRASPRGSSPASRTSPAPPRRTCCASTWRSRRAPARRSTASSPVTSPASPTDAG